MFAVLDDSCIFRNFYGGWSAQFLTMADFFFNFTGGWSLWFLTLALYDLARPCHITLHLVLDYKCFDGY